MRVPHCIKKPLQQLISPRLYQQITTEVRLFLTPKARCLDLCRSLLRHKEGFEIGGPSFIFSRKGLLPVYRIAGRVDNCNFSNNTIWEGSICEGAHFKFDASKPAGYQFIREAVDLHGIPSHRYDFILSSHNIEHVANAIKALREWLRILKEDGILVVVFPHKDGTFDRNRPVTPLEHYREDYERGMGEDDLTHFHEIKSLHDAGIDMELGDVTEFIQRCENNIEHRCIHHHVFDTRAAVALLDHVGVQICAVEALLPMHIVVVAKKLPDGQTPDNLWYLDGTPHCLSGSPFPSDHR